MILLQLTAATATTQKTEGNLIVNKSGALYNKVAALTGLAKKCSLKTDFGFLKLLLIRPPSKAGGSHDVA